MEAADLIAGIRELRQAMESSTILLGVAEMEEMLPWGRSGGGLRLEVFEQKYD